MSYARCDWSVTVFISRYGYYWSVTVFMISKIGLDRATHPQSSLTIKHYNTRVILPYMAAPPARPEVWLHPIIRRVLWRYHSSLYWVHFLSDEGPTLETLDFTIRIGSTPTFLYLDFYSSLGYANTVVTSQHILQTYFMKELENGKCPVFIEPDANTRKDGG